MSRATPAWVAELVDATDSKSVFGDGVWVRVPPQASLEIVELFGFRCSLLQLHDTAGCVGRGVRGLDSSCVQRPRPAAYLSNNDVFDSAAPRPKPVRFRGKHVDRVRLVVTTGGDDLRSGAVTTHAFERRTGRCRPHNDPQLISSIGPRAAPELAVMAATAHGDAPDGRATLEAVLSHRKARRMAG